MTILRAPSPLSGLSAVRPGVQHSRAGDEVRGGGRAVTVIRARSAKDVMDVILDDLCSTCVATT